MRWAEMRSISETEADEPSRGRGIFQQKNICDEGNTPTKVGVDGIIGIGTLVERSRKFKVKMSVERTHYSQFCSKKVRAKNIKTAP